MVMVILCSAIVDMFTYAKTICHICLIFISHSHPSSFRIPLREVLFNNLPLQTTRIGDNTTNNTSSTGYEVVTTGASISWSNRGRKRKDSDQNKFPRIDANGKGIPLRVKH